MPKDFSTADRVVLLLALVPYLDEHGPTPVAELAEAFSADAKLVRSLVTFLGMAGVPGETQSYQHEDLFDIDWTAFEEHDIVSLTRIVAVDDTPRFSAAEASALIAGLHLLTGMLPESERELAERTAEKLAAATAAPASVSTGVQRRSALSITAEAEDPRVAQLVTVLDRGRRLGFAYRDASGAETARTVEPLLLSQEAGIWYLRAFCLDRGEERTFRIDRMRELRELPEAAERAQRAGRTGLFGGDTAWAEGDPAITVRLRLREAALPRIAEFSPIVRGADADGWLAAEVNLGYSAAVVRLVRAAPGEIVIEGPPRARELVADWAERALAQYDL